MALTDEGVFDSALQKMGDGELDLGAGTFRIQGINATGAEALSKSTADLNYDDLTTTWLTHGPTDLTGVSWAGRVFDADNVAAFADPDNGNGDTTCIIIYKWSGLASTSPLIWFSEGATGTPMGQDFTADTVTFNASGIFKLDT